MPKSHHTLSGTPLLFSLLLVVAACTLALLATPYYYLAPAPALAFVGALLLKQYPLLAYYFMLFGIPHNNLRGASTKLLGFVLVGIVASQVIVERQSLKINNALLFPLTAFLIINILSALFSAYPATSMDDIRMLVVVVIFLFLALSLITPHAFLNTVPKIIIASISLGAYFGIYGYYTISSHRSCIP